MVGPREGSPSCFGHVINSAPRIHLLRQFYSLFTCPSASSHTVRAWVCLWSVTHQPVYSEDTCKLKGAHLYCFPGILTDGHFIRKSPAICWLATSYVSPRSFWQTHSRKLPYIRMTNRLCYRITIITDLPICAAKMQIMSGLTHETERWRKVKQDLEASLLACQTRNILSEPDSSLTGQLRRQSAVPAGAGWDGHMGWSGEGEREARTVPTALIITEKAVTDFCGSNKSTKAKNPAFRCCGEWEDHVPIRTQDWHVKTSIMRVNPLWERKHEYLSYIR